MRNFFRTLPTLTTLVLALTTACASTAQRNIASQSGELRSITAAAFEKFPKVGGSTLIKFVIGLKNGQPADLVVINPLAHDFHYQYLATTPAFKGAGVKEVRAASYAKKDRKILIGSFMVGMQFDEGQWDFRTPFQLTTEEALPPAEAKQVSDLLSAWIDKNVVGDDWTFSFPPETAYKPLEEHRAEVSANLAEYQKAGVRVKMSLVGGEVRAYAFGWGAGRVVAVESEAELQNALARGAIDQNTLLLTGVDILELPPVAGIISARAITEASHMVLLAQMYGIPLVYQKGALERFRSLNGHWAFLETKNGADDSYQFVGPLLESQVPAIQALRPKLSIQPKADWKTSAIVPVNKISAQQLPAYGGKASKFGLLQRTIPNNTRDLAFGIPLAYYHRFLGEARTAEGEKLGEAVKKVLGTLPANASQAQVYEKAAEVRALMKKATVPPALVNDIRQALAAFYPSAGEVRLKLRSSSNVEDGAEFNGAGLYDSEGICLSNCQKDDFAKGLVKVWSSLYTGRGLWARKRFGVHEEVVGMGILAHRPFKGETANGVAVFRFEKDYDDKMNPGCVILGVAGEEESVTNATEGGGNERVVVRRNEVSEVRPVRGQPDGRTLMAPQRYTEICSYMQKLHAAWPEKLGHAEIEAEWKLSAESGREKIYLKQVRQVPAPAVFNLPKNQVTTILPTAWGFRGEWITPISGAEHKLDLLSFRLGNPSYEDLRKGNFRVTEVFAHQRGKKISLAAGAPKMVPVKNYDGVVTHLEARIPLTGPAPTSQPPRTLAIAITKKEKGSLLLAPELAVNVTYSNLLPVYGHEEDLIADRKLMKKPMHEMQDTCPVQISWTSTQRWVGSDDEYRTLENVKIPGLLKRTIEIKAIPWAAYHRKLHETIESQYIDLYLDPSLTEAEKKTLDSLGGRYLDVVPEFGRFHLQKSLSDKGKNIKGCEVFDSRGGGDEGEGEGAE